MLETSDRLQPLVVETRRGPEQLMRILETLARVELTDGLSFAQLVLETAGRLPRDATVVAILASPSVETAMALGELRHKGLAVTAIINLYDDMEFERPAPNWPPKASRPGTSKASSRCQPCAGSTCSAE